MTPTPDTFLYDAFLSYRHCEPDRRFARSLLARLEGAGLKLAIDQRDFSPEATFLEEMERCIRQSRFTLAVLSPRYLESGNTREEAILCKVLDMGERRRRLIPLILEPVERPVWLYDIVGVDFSDPQALVDPHARLLAALSVSQRVQAADEGGGPEPCFADATTQSLAKALEESYRREEELLSAGADAMVVRQEILELRRQLREGGRLRAGDFLADGRFRLIEPLGRGGFATVWKAFDRQQRGLVAIKVLHGQFAEDRSRRERFFRGARKMEELHHPGIVRVIEKHLQDGGYHFYVMEYLSGGDLRAAVLGQHPAPAAVLPVLQEVAAALSFAHERGVVHRDVKPANILLDSEGHPKLTDFDLVRAADTTGGSLDGGMTGTFLYSAPETMSTPQDAGVTADVYSLAMTVIFCLYGADLPPHEILQDAGGFLRRLPCPSSLQDVLRKAVSLRLEDRLGSIAQLSQALEQGLAPPVRETATKEVTKRKPRERPAVQALVLGFGGTGAQILTSLKELTLLKYGRKPHSLRFLLFDTIADWQPGGKVKILGGVAEEKVAIGLEENASLDPALEYFFLSDHDPDLRKHVFEHLAPAGNPESPLHLKDWLHAPWLRLHIPSAQLDLRNGAAQLRQVGRFALFQNAERIAGQIQTEIRRLRESERGVVNVWIIGSSAGGTGAGCLIDAAFLARRAAGDTPVSIAGVVVLPEVYSDKEGISRGRAYSLFRELDRFQEQGCLLRDRFFDGRRISSSRVRYDARHRLDSVVGSRLFDNLFYVGTRCDRDPERTSFFTALANSIDPFLEEEAGPLLQASVNFAAAASSFGAARLFIPAEIYAGLFAWEEVERYLKGVGTSRGGGDVLDFQDSMAQVRREGETMVRSLLPFFQSILDLSQRQEDRLRSVARSLSPRSIVNEWYGFAGPAVEGLSLPRSEQQVVLLTCINPYISWTEDETPSFPSEERTLKTFQENKRSKGPKEDKAQSRDRFAAELEHITACYCGVYGGNRCFEAGRRLVMDKLTTLLRSRVDALVTELLQKPRYAFDLDTAMARLFESFKEILADGGPLQRTDIVVSQLLETMQGEETARQGAAVRADRNLREWVPSSWFGVSVEELQASARDEAAEYIAAYQKVRLFQDMQKLVREVRGRFEEWTALVKRMFDGLVLGAEYSCLAETRKHLRRLGSRLGRLAENETVLISCADPDAHDPVDLTMQGYREILRHDCVLIDGRTTLAEAALSASRWQATLDIHSQPQIHLVVRIGEGERRYGADTVMILHRDLSESFREQIDLRMDQHDIFDYLLHVQQPPYQVETDKVAQLLFAAAKVLIDSRSPDLCTLLYRDPVDDDKRNLARAIGRSLSMALGNNDFAESHNSDRFSLTLVKIRKPHVELIDSLWECREDYLKWQQGGKTGQSERGEEFYRAQVCHPFRPELEAWFIERRHFSMSNRTTGSEDHITPRLVRLLEDPAMMQAFVHCVATGAVERADGDWVWHDSANNREVLLTERGTEPTADLVRAAVVFVLQQRAGKRQGLIPIRLEDARRSAADAAQAQSRSRDDLIKEFVATRLGPYLDSHCSDDDEEETCQRERRGLRMLFEFYADPETRTQLSDRLDGPLPRAALTA